MSKQLENIPIGKDGLVVLDATFQNPALNNLNDSFEQVMKMRKLMERGLASEAEWLNAMVAYSDEANKANKLGLINFGGMR